MLPEMNDHDPNHLLDSVVCTMSTVSLRHPAERNRVYISLPARLVCGDRYNCQRVRT